MHLQARHRDAFGAEQARLSELANAVDVAKAQLAKAANDLATATVENEAARAELEKRRWVGACYVGFIAQQPCVGLEIVLNQ